MDKVLTTHHHKEPAPHTWTDSLEQPMHLKIVRMDHRETEWEVVYWIHLAQENDQ